MLADAFRLSQDRCQSRTMVVERVLESRDLRKVRVDLWTDLRGTAAWPARLEEHELLYV